MKKILAVLLMLSLTGPAGFSQDDEIRPAAIGVSFLLNDFTTADRIRSTSLSSVLNKGSWAKLTDMSPGIAISYFKGLRRLMDFSGTLAGTFPSFDLPNRAPTSGDRFLLEADAALNFKLVSEKYWVQPYAIAGIGAQMYGGTYFGAFVPLGLGMKLNLFDDAHLFATSQYRVPVTTETAVHHFFNQIGIAGRIGKKKEPELKPLPPAPPADTDKDGINDSLDKCPTVPGLEKYEGCPVPDGDKDGINDEEDKCPAAAGLARYQGCPIPDTDKDGINDEEDKCPAEAGPASNQGCPFVDTDGDGIPDPEDKCPNLAGTKENQGCPEVKEEVVKKVNYAAQNIYFATGKSTLLSKSFKGLNEVAQIMKENTDLKLAINGHTDDVGNDAFNQKLSENRAAAVKAYLVKKGVDESRLESVGHGETEPVADNKTATGRQKNRRVELKLNYF
ncbi:OmpA family protein [Terrimonas pollutisoli]|uniref:OmpA family protein n=1 Tax=Terrimonas pollutisoli TaxID=3034147 RepID=UPI0023EC3E55|nr:OmpA family protein [Terrimonas sp. H1YJ31]